MAVLAVAITPDSPEGTKAIVIGVSAAPSLPAAGAAGASASLSQIGGMGVGTVVGVMVGVGGTGVGGTAVGGWVAVGAGGCVAGGWVATGTGAAVVAAGPQAVSSMTATTSIDTNRYNFFIFSLLSRNKRFGGDFSPH